MAGWRFISWREALLESARFFGGMVVLLGIVVVLSGTGWAVLVIFAIPAVASAVAHVLIFKILPRKDAPPPKLSLYQMNAERRARVEAALREGRL